MGESTKLAPIHLDDLQRARASRGDALFRAVNQQPVNPPTNPPTTTPQYLYLSAGQLVSNNAGTYFLLDDMQGKLIARGFLEGDTYHALVGNAPPQLIPDAAFGVLDGYQAIESGSSLAQIYGSAAVWFIDGGLARGITSGDAFQQYHFNYNSIQTWSSSALGSLKQDQTLYISTSNLQRKWKISGS